MGIATLGFAILFAYILPALALAAGVIGITLIVHSKKLPGFILLTFGITLGSWLYSILHVDEDQERENYYAAKKMEMQDWDDKKQLVRDLSESYWRTQPYSKHQIYLYFKEDRTVNVCFNDTILNAKWWLANSDQIEFAKTVDGVRNDFSLTDFKGSSAKLKIWGSDAIVYPIKIDSLEYAEKLKSGL